MAKTLFFIEALAFALMAAALPIFAAEASAAFIIPAAISIALPLSCALAVWPAGDVAFALRAAFSGKAPGATAARGAARTLDFLADIARLSAPLGMLLAAAAVLARKPSAGSPRVWALLGIYLAAYALVNAQLGRTLAAVVGRLAATADAKPDPGVDSAVAEFAAVHGLTPRERETAALIAGGKSYKEAAYELGISIRTVKAHMGSVYAKTGAPSNVALALLIRGTGPSTTKVQ
jgi:DNA-binding CsgD family transcriptional regulator